MSDPIVLSVEDNTQEIPLEIEQGGGADPAELAKKADKVRGAVSGNFAGLDENGNLTDSGKSAEDFAGSEELDEIKDEITGLEEDIAGKLDSPEETGTQGQILALALINNELVPVWITPAGGGVEDVQVNGTSVVQNGVANVPQASHSALGVVKTENNYGILVNASNGRIYVDGANSLVVKTGTDQFRPVVPYYQHNAVFYGLSKLAGEDLKNDTVTVGTYPEKSLSAISQMLNAPVSISGTTPTIPAMSGIRYICGEVTTLTITAPASGCIDVVFTSGSTPTVLTVTSAKANTTIKWLNGFDPTSLEANTTYEVNILDGEFGVVGSWT